MHEVFNNFFPPTTVYNQNWGELQDMQFKNSDTCNVKRHLSVSAIQMCRNLSQCVYLSKSVPTLRVARELVQNPAADGDSQSGGLSLLIGV